MNSRHHLAGALLCATILLPAHSHAATYACIGKVDNVTSDPNGEVNASFIFETGTMSWQSVCSINTPINNVSVAACKGILSVLLSAKTSQQRVMMWFDNQTTSQCSAPGWQPLRTMGWYWGPAIVN